MSGSVRHACFLTNFKRRRLSRPKLRISGVDPRQSSKANLKIGIIRSHVASHGARSKRATVAFATNRTFRLLVATCL